MGASTATSITINFDTTWHEIPTGWLIYCDGILVGDKQDSGYLSREFTVNDLIPDTEYEFTVIPYNNNGEGPIGTLWESTLSPIFINSDICPTSTSVTFEWGKNEGNFVINNYDIYFDNIFIKNTIETTMTFNNLQPETPHDIKIIAYGTHGEYNAVYGYKETLATETYLKSDIILSSPGIIHVSTKYVPGECPIIEPEDYDVYIGGEYSGSIVGSGFLETELSGQLEVEIIPNPISGIKTCVNISTENRRRPPRFEWTYPKKKDEPYIVSAEEWNRFQQYIIDMCRYLYIAQPNFNQVDQGNYFYHHIFDKGVKESLKLLNFMTFDTTYIENIKDKKGAFDVGVGAASPIIARDFNELRDCLNSIP